MRPAVSSGLNALAAMREDRRALRRRLRRMVER
jgi:hypothetical protein